MAPDTLFSRDEVLGGLPARRAAATLFSIESRAAWLAHRSAQTLDVLLSEDAARTRELAFLDAFSAGREPPVPPTIQTLERFAPHLAALVPPGAPLRAAVAHMLGAKYRFTRDAIPSLRAALGLDDPAVAEAYRRQYRAEIASLYVPRMPLSARAHMAWQRLAARIDALPPFWLTFFLTLAFSFSQAFLALPTGIARLGVLPGIALVAAVGLVNVATMAGMAEACARSGDFRYGKAFLARLISGYLGSGASLVFSLVTALRTLLVMLAGSIGIALTLTAATGIRAEVWVALVAFVELGYLWRRSQTVTITTMLTLLGVNLALVLLIKGVALTQVDLSSLAAASAREPGALKLAFGVVVMLYIGHVYVVQCAKIVLPRDPSARALIRGSVAGTLALMGLFTTWIVAVNGVVPADRLAREAGTTLPALAERVGPSLLVLGTILVVSLLGMSCLRTTTVMFNLVQERLPTRIRFTVGLPRRRGDLIFSTRGLSVGAVRLGIRYLGLADGLPRFRVERHGGGTTTATDVVVSGAWDATPLLAPAPRTAALGIEVIDVDPDLVSLRVTTTMTLAAGGEWAPGAWQALDIVQLDPSLRETAVWLLRRGDVTAGDVARERGGTEAEARDTLESLVRRGVAEHGGRGTDAYRIRLAPRRPRAVPAALADGAAPARVSAPRLKLHPRGIRLAALRALLSGPTQFAVSASPVLLVFVVAEAMLLTASGTFAGVLGFGGVIANSMTAGIFPVLLLVASRRKGEREPAVVYGWLGHPVITGSVYVLAVTMLFVHGAAIYSDPWVRACAVAAGGVVLGVTAHVLRHGAFGRRTVVELRESARDGSAVIGVMSAGAPLPADIVVTRLDGDEGHRASTVTIPNFAKVTGITVRLPAGNVRDVKVWGHHVTVDETTEALPVAVEVTDGRTTRGFDLRLTGGQAIARVEGAACTVRIVPTHADTQ